MRLNEFARPNDDDKYNEEDLDSILDTEINGKWTKMSLDELIALNNRIGGLTND